jgi:integrase
MKKPNFTAERIAGFVCDVDKQQSIFWDGKSPGLGLRVTATGAKSFIFESRLHGKTLRITIGDIRTWPIAKAQNEATRLRSLTDQGIDPRQQRRDQRSSAEALVTAAVRQEIRLCDAWPLYIEDRRPRWGKLHYDAHVRLSASGGQSKKRGAGVTVPGPLSRLLPFRLGELTSSRIGAWLSNEAKTRPTAAALSYRLLRAFMGWTAEQPLYSGLIPEDAFSAKSVREVLPKSRATEGDSLQREQLADWFAAIKRLPNLTISTYLQGLLITGARRNELGGLRWEDVDFQWQSLTIRDKVEGTRTIPLTPYFAALLMELKRQNDTPPNIRQLRRMNQQMDEWRSSPWVFSSDRAADGKLAEPRLAHTAALDAAGLPHISLQGLRRSFGTLCEWVEVPAGISAQIMGHKPSALAEKHYRRRPLDLLRKWHEVIEAWILEQAGIEFDAPDTGARKLRLLTTH